MRFLKVQVVVAALGLLGAVGSANAVITLSPSTAGVIPGYGYGPSNCENVQPTNCVEAVFGVSDLNLLYKSNFSGLFLGLDEGPYAFSYTTTFTDSIFDPSDATIAYNGFGLPAISCASCYLAIKDGNHSPGYYFYDLSGWNGVEEISLQDFWPDRGAISHISIWGGSSSTVPEPATLGLFGLGLLGVGMARRRRKA